MPRHPRKSPVATAGRFGMCLVAAVGVLLAGCSSDDPAPVNPMSAVRATILGAETVVWARAGEPDGSTIDVEQVLAGSAAVGALEVDLGDFAGEGLPDHAIYVLSSDDPPRVLLQPGSGMLTPRRVQRVLDGGELVSTPRTATEIEQVLPGADSVTVSSFEPAADGMSATIVAVDETVAGTAPDEGDTVEVGAGADWDLTAEQGRGHLVLQRSAGRWVVLIEPFGPGAASDVNWELVQP